MSIILGIGFTKLTAGIASVLFALVLIALAGCVWVAADIPNIDPNVGDE